MVDFLSSALDFKGKRTIPVYLVCKSVVHKEQRASY